MRRAVLYPVLRATIISSTFFVLLIIASNLAINELDRLVADVVSEGGRAHSLKSVFGLGAAAETEAWADWRDSAFKVLPLVRLSIYFDLIFIGCYAWLGVRLVNFARDRAVRANTAIEAAASGTGSAPVLLTTSRRWPLFLLLLLVGADVAEDALLFTLTVTADHQPLVALAQVVLTYLKWASTIVLGVHIIFGDLVGGVVRPFFGDAIRAVYAQRLVAIVVGAVAAVSLISADGLFEQVPDAYRGWVVYPEDSEGTLVGFQWRSFLFTAAAFLATGAALLAFGRHRARQYAITRDPDLRPPARLLPWLLFAMGIALVAIIVAAAAGGDSVDWLRLLVFLLVALAIPGVSWVIAKSSPPVTRTVISENVAPYAVPARHAADLLVAVWIVVGTFGPFKAMLAPLYLDASGKFDNSRFENSFANVMLIAIGYLLGGLVATIAFRNVLARLTPATQLAEAPKSTNRFWLTLSSVFAPVETVPTAVRRWVFVAFRAAVVFAALIVCAFLLFPIHVALVVGPVAVIVFLAGALATLIGSLILTLGRRRPLPVFSRLRLRSAPIVTLLVVIPLAASFIDGAPGQHAIRMDSDPLSPRDTLTTAFAAWYDSDPQCETSVDGTRVKPLVLVAAEGGGIRAATWTVNVLRELPQAGACAAAAVFLSSGASGGSIGLASFQLPSRATSEDPDAIIALGKHNTISLGGPGALAADLAGLLAGDLVGGMTGIRAPTPSSMAEPFSHPWIWHDRTALQEIVWEEAHAPFAESFRTASQSPTGYLVLNSTDSISNCKVIVSQLDLMDVAGATSSSPFPNAPQCNGTGAELANAIDLFDYLGACDKGMSLATAAELSARFPFVSPAGRISASTLPSGCNEVTDMQLVDGGITDNSAIGTVSDLAPALTALIRATNLAAEKSGDPFVVPVLLFASNEPGTDLRVEPDGTRPEILIPPAALLNAKAAQVSPASWLTRASSGYEHVCPDGDEGDTCRGAVEGIRSVLPGGVVVAAPTTTPAISVPLGWTLSSFSRSRLRFESNQQSLCGRAPAIVTPPEKPLDADSAACRASGEYGDLGDLLDLIDANAESTFAPAG